MQFVIQKPVNEFLATLVDSYFFVDVPATELKPEAEYVLPFPRITFGYFFDHPFVVTNHKNGETIIADMIISRISAESMITVQPQTNHVKILGAHVRPYTLAFLTNEPIGNLPWLIKTEALFYDQSRDFKIKVDRCDNAAAMFAEVENIFLSNILPKDLSVIKSAVDHIDAHHGNVKLRDLAASLGISERTLRTRFHEDIGCSPKEYSELVRLKWSVYEMKNPEKSLTEIGHHTEHFDQAHFTNTVKKITGRSPKKLRQEMPGFRFLQF
jgi:AraC-like DNA-binding protein